MFSSASSTDIPQATAIVGSGVSGLVTAYLLAKRNKKVVVFESEDRLGGHALTTQGVDLGFQVYNLTTYPYLQTIFDELNVATEPSDMSFSVSRARGFEWASHGVFALFADPLNLFRVSFWVMLYDAFRFSRNAKETLDPNFDMTMTLGQYLNKNRYSESFALNYLLPMGAAIWSVPNEQMMNFPVSTMVRFFTNHHMLHLLGERPRWRVCSKRSDAYVQAIRDYVVSRGGEFYTSSPVLAVKNRTSKSVTLVVGGGNDAAAGTKDMNFDSVVFATHAPTTLKILGGSATQEESTLLGKIRYQANEIVLHSDTSLMPKSTRAWSSWNVVQSANSTNSDDICVTYWLNHLQNLPKSAPLRLCTLNPCMPIKKEAIALTLTLEHPVLDVDAIKAQDAINRMQQDSTARNVWFTGAWLGSGFHEDGARSAVAVACKMDAKPEWTQKDSDIMMHPVARGPEPATFSLVSAATFRVFDSFAKSSFHYGFLKIVFPNGNEVQYGRPSYQDAVKHNEPTCEMRVWDLGMFDRLLAESDIALAEAYISKAFTLPNGQEDLKNLLLLLVLNRESCLRELNQYKVLAGPMKLAGALMYRVGNLVNYFKHLARDNTIEGSRRNIQEHYDLGNDLYALFLDQETWTYSCGIYTQGPETPLKDAQLAKYDRLIQKAGLTSASKVMEIGCGWGGMAIRAVQRTGCTWVGITISTEQLAFAQDRVKKCGLDSKITLKFCDYRLAKQNIGGDFDAVISIEMLEAVGHNHLTEYFEVVSSVLKPGGVACIQVIGNKDENYDEYLKSSDFIRRHIFPGSNLPSMKALHDSMKGTKLSIAESFDIGPDYALTLEAWRRRFTASKHDILKLGYSEEFFRKWIFYFVYCEAGFQLKHILDWQLVLRKEV